MKLFQDLTFKRVKKEIMFWENSNETHTIDVLSIGQELDEDCYQNGELTCEQFFANVIIDGEETKRGYEWDIDNEDIVSSWDWNQDDDDEGELPSNVIARCEYAGQALDTFDLSEAQVDINGALPYGATYIRMAYPFEIEGNGSYNVYKINEAKTWGELLTEIIKVFQREYEAGKAIAPHVLGDYVIERIDIHPGDCVTVGIGS